MEFPKNEDIDMNRRPVITKVLAIVISIVTAALIVPLSVAERMGATPLGIMATQGTVTVGGNVAPTGATVFAGDIIKTTDLPALISFSSGGRVEMTKAVAAFSREGGALIVQPVEGLLRFSFVKGEDVRIQTDRYSFTAIGRDSSHVGELGLNRNGQIVLAMTAGSFATVDNVSQEKKEVSPNQPLEAIELQGKGKIEKNGNSLTDSAKAYSQDALKKRCLVAEKEAHAIVANSATVITIKGSWKLNSGDYEYKVADCTKDALLAAGASAASASAAVGAAASIGAAAGAGAAGAAAGLSTAAVVGIVGGTAAALGVGIGVYEATKSPSAP